jgi:hypothetical protein
MLDLVTNYSGLLAGKAWTFDQESISKQASISRFTYKNNIKEDTV